MLEFFAISNFILLAIISPGPDFLLLSKNTLGLSRSAGIYTASGLATGALILASSCLFGLMFTISKSILAFNILRLTGGIYLIYIGSDGLLRNNLKTNSIIDNVLDNRAAFRQGFICSILNPKGTLFFLALFTTMIRQDTALSTQIGYSLEVVLLYLIWFMSLSMIISSNRISGLLSKFYTYVYRGAGIALIILGYHTIKNVKPLLF